MNRTKRLEHAALSQFGQKVLRHWEENFPRDAEALHKAGILEAAAHRVSEQAAGIMEQALGQGHNWSTAHELAMDVWKTPPT